MKRYCVHAAESFLFLFSIYFATLSIVGGRLPFFTGIVVRGFI